MSEISNTYSNGLIYYTIGPSLSLPSSLLSLITATTPSFEHSLTIYLSLPNISELRAKPAKYWSQIQYIISRCYVSATNQAFKVGRMLMNVTVLIDGWSRSIEDVVQLSSVDCLIALKGDSVAVEKFNSLNANRNPHIPVILHNPSTTETLMDIPVDHIQSGCDKYTHVALGGTFDHLHAGHKILLTMAAWISDYKLLCGIVAPSMLKSKKYAQQLESLEVRISGVLQFLGQVSPKLIPSAVPIYDPHGPASILPDLGVIVVSEETIAGAGSINEAREKNGLKPLDVRVIAVISESKVGEESMDLKISSTGIRKYLDSLSREHSSK